MEDDQMDIDPDREIQMMMGFSGFGTQEPGELLFALLRTRCCFLLFHLCPPFPSTERAALNLRHIQLTIFVDMTIA